MKYIKLFENFDNSLQYFCETNLYIDKYSTNKDIKEIFITVKQ